MIIKHVAVLGVKREKSSPGEKGEDTHSIHINLSYIPDNVWTRCFQNEWRKLFLAKIKRIEIIDDELRFVLKKSENIQSYIDIINQLIIKTNNLVDLYNKGFKDPYQNKIERLRRVKKYRLAR